MEEDESGRVAYLNMVDRQGACSLLKEMLIWSMRLSESVDELHTFMHNGEGDPEELVMKILLAKDAIACMWAVPAPNCNGSYALATQTISTTLN